MRGVPFRGIASLAKERKGREEVLDAAASAIVFALHEPHEHARKVAKAADRSARRTVEIWKAVGEESAMSTRRRVDRVSGDDVERLSNFLAGGKRQGIALFTIHLGAYVLGILRLLATVGDRTVFFLRRVETATTSFEAKAFAKLEALGIRFEVVRLGGRGVWRVLKGLREGGVAVLLYDLPRRWGPTVPVDVLGTGMAWVRGPYELAVRSEALAVPFFCMDGKGGECHLTIGRVVDFSSAAPPTWGQAASVQLVAQAYADAASLAIRSFPGQWHHWNLIGEMTGDGRAQGSARGPSA